MEQKGFFGSLFDLSFTDFVTIRIIKVLFIISILCSGLWSLIMLISLIAGGGGKAFLGIILAPILFILSVLMARIWLEVIIVLFRIAENTSRLVEMTQDEKNPSSDEK